MLRTYSLDTWIILISSLFPTLNSFREQELHQELRDSRLAWKRNVYVYTRTGRSKNEQSRLAIRREVWYHSTSVLSLAISRIEIAPGYSLRRQYMNIYCPRSLSYKRSRRRGSFKLPDSQTLLDHEHILSLFAISKHIASKLW